MRRTGCCKAVSPAQPRHQGGGEQRRRQFQSDDQQQLGGVRGLGCVRRRPSAMRVPGASRAEQQHGVQRDHGQRHNRHLMQRTNAAVAPDMNRARHADGGQGNHEEAQPGAMVARSCKPEVQGTGSSADHGAGPGMQDGTVGADRSRRRRPFHQAADWASGRSHRCRPRCGRPRPAGLGWRARPAPGCGQRSLRGGA
jgi:hypothetical protein